MIPRLLLRVLWGVEDIAILWICFSESRFNDCLRWHSIARLPFGDIIHISCTAVSISKGDNVVSGIQPSLLFKTIKYDQLSPSTTECQHGRYLNSEDLPRKVSGIPRMIYSNRRLSIRTQALYQGWFPNETTVRNINYSIDPLVTAFFNDPFSWLFGKNSIIFLFFPAASARSLRNPRCPA